MIRAMNMMRKPAFSLPRGACDTHVHIWGPFDHFPVAKGAPYTPPKRTRDDLVALHERLGVDRAVIVQTTVYKSDNRAMLDGIARSGGRWCGVALIDEHFTDADFLSLHEGGVRGVRFGFVKHLGGVPDLALVRRTAARIAPMGWHLVLHLDAGNIPEFIDFFGELSLPVVVDHMGRVPVRDGSAALSHFAGFAEAAELVGKDIRRRTYFGNRPALRGCHSLRAAID